MPEKRKYPVPSSRLNAVSVHTNSRIGIPAYRILAEVGARRLTLYRGEEVVMQEPVGVGKGRTPTPTGNFYVDAMVRLSNPNTVWGPFQMSVSGFSNVLDRFMGGIVMGSRGWHQISYSKMTVDPGGGVKLRSAGAGVTNWMAV